MNELGERFYLESSIELRDETAALRKEVSSVITLPAEEDRQMDLQYFSAVFVSSGENLNNAFFLPSELVAAKGTISSKALDVEHEENEIIGHLYDYAFTDKEGNKLEEQELANTSKATINKKEMHIVVAGIIYKNRFPNIADEVSSGKWKVSMECYYQGYDVKIGDLIISKKEAEMLGFASKDSSFGKTAKVIKEGIEIASGTITRVLRHICFSGCGIVKNPANPPSVVLETASEKKADEIIILDYDALTDGKESSNNVTSSNIEDNTDSKRKGSVLEDEATLEDNDTVGICVSYKKEVIDSTFKGPDTKVVHSNWCSLFSSGCTSFSRDTTDPECLRNVARKEAQACTEVFIKQRREKDKRLDLVESLQSLVTKAKKIIKN